MYIDNNKNMFVKHKWAYIIFINKIYISTFLYLTHILCYTCVKFNIFM